MSPAGGIWPVEQLSTGFPALDAILGGGIPLRSVNLISGEPGAGKTVLTLGMIFNAARAGKKTLFFTTLSEPAPKLIRYLQSFPFFDEKLVGDRVVFIDLGATIRGEGPAKTLAAITGHVEREEPDLIAIDSFKALLEFLPEPAERRLFVYDLAVHAPAWGATTFLLGEYMAADLAARPEFGIADGIIRLSNEAVELTAVRGIEVLKLRGAEYQSGRHFFEIGRSGLAFYPRVRAPEPDERQVSLRDRIASGTPGLDELFAGGIPRASATVAQGGTGTGKTLLALQYLIEGARRGEPGILFTLEETPSQLRAVAEVFGWDLPALEAKGLLTLDYTSPVELSTDRFLNRARGEVERVSARRVVLDSVTALGIGIISERRFKEVGYSLTKHFRKAEVTFLMTMETPALLGEMKTTGPGLSFTADNVIHLRYGQTGSRIERALTIVKARGVRVDSELRRLELGERGLAVGGPFVEAHEALAGRAAGDAGKSEGSSS